METKIYFKLISFMIDSNDDQAVLSELKNKFSTFNDLLTPSNLPELSSDELAELTRFYERALPQLHESQWVQLVFDSLGVDPFQFHPRHFHHLFTALESSHYGQKHPDYLRRWKLYAQEADQAEDITELIRAYLRFRDDMETCEDLLTKKIYSIDLSSNELIQIIKTTKD